MHQGIPSKFTIYLLFGADSDRTYEFTKTRVVTQESSTTQKERDVIDEAEKSDLEKEYDESEEDSRLSCCRDIIQTVVNVLFFLIIAFPIRKYSY